MRTRAVGLAVGGQAERSSPDSAVLDFDRKHYDKLISSSILEYENSRNPYPIRQEAVNRYIQLAELRQEVDEAIRQRAEELEQNRLKAIDALHVGCAEAINSNYFITCD